MDGGVYAGVNPKHYLLYGHGGAYNHGSEASVRCDIALLRRIAPGCRITLSSHFPEQDREYALDADEIIGRNPDGQTAEEIYWETIRRITPETVCLSVGGDNYCYPNWQRYAAIHYAALKRGAKSLLWSCSLEPSLLEGELLKAVQTHHFIMAREEYTAQALRKRGVQNVIRVSDIAFLLKPEAVPLPPKPYIVLNLSPLLLRKNPNALRAYQRLVNEILSRIDIAIVLLPHVEIPVDNDLDALGQLTGPPERIIRVPGGLRAAQYKFILSQAEICVAARTHATIAAWSSQTPCIAIGYSIKARGVAVDVGQERYALDGLALNGEILCGTFWRLWAQREAVRAVLAERVPVCTGRAVPEKGCAAV